MQYYTTGFYQIHPVIKEIFRMISYNDFTVLLQSWVFCVSFHFEKYFVGIGANEQFLFEIEQQIKQEPYILLLLERELWKKERSQSKPIFFLNNKRNE